MHRRTILFGTLITSMFFCAVPAHADEEATSSEPTSASGLTAEPPSASAVTGEPTLASDVNREPTSASSVKVEPKFAVGVNILQPALYSIASAFYPDSFLLPVPIEAHIRIKDKWGMVALFQYLHHKDASLMLNGFQVSTGPRYCIVGTALSGLYVSMKVGLSYRTGDDYSSDSYARVGMTLQPEIGYSLVFGPPGLFLAFGVGLQAEIPLSETEHSSWTWNGLGEMVNFYLPYFNATVGFVL